MLSRYLSGIAILALSGLLYSPTLLSAEQSVPAPAVVILPQLKAVQLKEWPKAPIPSFLAGQIEQETCITLKHKKCWNTHAELKTDRERGVGLPQLTKTAKFDNIQLAKDALKWNGSEYDLVFQLRSLVWFDLKNFNALKGIPDERERLHFTLSAYNGGLGGVLKDRSLCQKQYPKCDPNKWFGNVERTSTKAKAPLKGYGQSFFMINRGYVDNIINKRRLKYVPYMEPGSNHAN